MVHTVGFGQVPFTRREEQNFHAVGKPRVAYDAGINHSHVAHPICTLRSWSHPQLWHGLLFSAVPEAMTVGRESNARCQSCCCWLTFRGWSRDAALRDECIEVPESWCKVLDKVQQGPVVILWKRGSCLIAIAGGSIWRSLRFMWPIREQHTDTGAVASLYIRSHICQCQCQRFTTSMYCAVYLTFHRAIDLKIDLPRPQHMNLEAKLQTCSGVQDYCPFRNTSYRAPMSL